MKSHAPVEDRLGVLDALRGLLAVWVMVAHVASRVLTDTAVQKLHLQAVFEPLIPVYIFMILSGFVIFHLLHRQYDGYQAFLVRRFFRLTPLYFFILPISVLMAGFELHTLELLPWINGDILDSIKVHRNALKEFWPHVIAHVSLLHGAIPDRVLEDAPFTFLSQGWSISLEWQFYLIAPVLFLLAKPGRLLWLALAVLVLVILGSIGYGAVGYLPSQLIFFAVGILSFYLFRYSTWYDRINGRVRGAAVLAAAVALYYWATNPLPWMVWLITMHILFAHRTGPSFMGRISGSRPLIRLGDISYSIYLLHIPILYIVFFLLLRIFPPLEPWQFLSMALPFTFAATLAGATLTHRFIEKPGVKLGRTLAHRIADR